MDETSPFFSWIFPAPSASPSPFRKSFPVVNYPAILSANPSRNPQKDAKVLSNPNPKIPMLAVFVGAEGRTNPDI